MPRAYHNLNGWIRDVRAALDAGDETGYIAAELVLELEDLIDPSMEPASDGPVQQPEADLDLRDDGDGTELESLPAGYDTVCNPTVDSFPGVVPAALGHARVSAASAAASQSDGGASGVVRATPGRTHRDVSGGT